MSIPVFISCPSRLNEKQKEYNEKINCLLADFGFERRALGISDYATDYPLKEVYDLAKHCAGGVILGFEQIYIEKGLSKRGTSYEKALNEISIPTPWNHLEAGILYSLQIPLLIIREKRIEGGIFDYGTSAYFVHDFESDVDLKKVLLKWAVKVNEYYNKM